MNNKNDNMQTVDVIISGLGPTGATLAHLLGKRGLSVVVLEREPSFYGNARAVYTDDECMRVMQAAGVADDLAVNMQVDTPAQWVLANGKVLGQYWRLDRPYGWPIINFLYQPWLETTLSDLLKRYPTVRVARGRELTRFEQDDEGVTVTHQASSDFRFSDASDARCESAVSRHVDPDKFIVKRKLVYTFNALVAKDWRKGRVLIAGDAAHMTPQFMGQGMSSGVRDAYNLAWKLDAVLKGRASDRLLDTYGSERFHHAKAMIDISVKMKDFVSMSNPITSRLRNLLVKTVMVSPVLGRYVREGRFKPAPTYALDSYLGMPRRNRRAPEGTMIPQPEVRTFKGQRVLLDDVLGEGFALIGLKVDPREHLSAASRQLLDAQGTRYASVFAFGTRPQGTTAERVNSCELVEIEDVHGAMLAWFKRAGFSSGAIAVVRPDKFTFAMVKAGDLDLAITELKFQLQWTPTPESLADLDATSMRKSA